MDAIEREAPMSLHPPSAEMMLDAIFRLSRDIHLEASEADVAQRFLHLFAELFPQRRFAIRVLDPRSTDRARIYGDGAGLRRGLETERIVLKRSSVEKTRLKTAVAESAWLRLGDRWDPPFPGVAVGYAVPLVAAGELYGVLDVGYPLGVDPAVLEGDEAQVLPIANQLSIALRNERLHHDTTQLRDYQSKLIEHASALILGVDSAWRITVCNQALCRLTGFTSAEVIGRDLRDWLPEEERPRLTKTFRSALGGKDADAIDAELVTKHGVRVRTVWSIAPIASRGAIQAVVAVGQDQTKLRELQGHLIQAEKLATLGQLAAGVAHELNNPLTSITVYAEYLLKKAEARQRAGEGDEGDVAKLEKIAAGAQRIMAFARDLVQYAKPAGESFEPIAMATVVRQALSFCEHLFDRAPIELAVDLEDELPPAEAVPGQLEQVVINLVTNAVQACGASGKVEVRAFRVGGDEVAVAVGDSGPGVAAADRERIFDPFFTTKTGGRGTGLGLSIVRNIVDHHKGRVRVDRSALGGALFVVSVPIAGSSRR
jgi:two-component system, NtrC family, sensor kinase